jgi:transposase
MTSTPQAAISATQTTATVCLGLDISKAKLDACLLRVGHRPHHRQFDNSRAGLQALQAWCQRLGHAAPLTVLEATGRYSDLAASLLHAAGFAVHLANPRRIKDYARSLGRRNKTDRLDAELIAAFGLSRPLPAWVPPAPELLLLRSLLRRLSDLQTLRQAENNRTEAATEAQVLRKSLTRIIRALDREIAHFEALILAHVAAHPALQADVDRLCHIEGIGARTAWWLCAEVPRHLPNPRAAAAWLGVTPRLRQSGATLRHTAPIGGDGNRHLRKVLFMAAMTARRCNPRLQAFADRLAANGKSKLSVIIAVLHKLLKISFAMLQHQSSYLQDHQPLLFSKK